MRAARGWMSWALVAACVGSAWLAACGGAGSPASDGGGGGSSGVAAAEIVLTADGRGALSAGNELGLSLFRAVLVDTDRPNVVIAPLSISLALALSVNAMEGGPQDAARAALGFADVPLERMNSGFAELLSRLSAAPGVVFTAAQSVWLGRAAGATEEAFLATCRDSYDADVFDLADVPGDPAGAIDEWVSQRTAGRIPHIASGALPDDAAALVNALYFLGRWAVPFEETDTWPAPFWRAGCRRDVPTMHRTGAMAYAERGGAQAVGLRYSGGPLALAVILPPPGQTAAAFAAGLDAAEWERWRAAFDGRLVALSLPVVTAAAGAPLSLDGPLAQVTGGAFAGAALPRLCAGCRVGSVLHASFLAIDEEGTEAAAATAVTGAEMAAPSREEPVPLTVDRPFLVLLYEHGAGGLLFVGLLGDPAEDDPEGWRCDQAECATDGDCDDEDPCTADVCAEGACRSLPAECVDPVDPGDDCVPDAPCDVGAPCAVDADCGTLCAPVGPEGAAMCTRWCIERCPEGYECRQYIQRLPDMAYVCQSPSAPR